MQELDTVHLLQQQMQQLAQCNKQLVQRVGQLAQRVAVLEGGTSKGGFELKNDDCSTTDDAAPMQMMQNPTFKQRRKSSAEAIRRKSVFKGKRRSSMQAPKRRQQW